jgi:hypothetical protein
MSGGLSTGSGNNSSQTYQTSNSSSTSTPPPAIEGILKTMSQNLTNYYLNNPNAPAYYPGSTVAQFSPQTLDALRALYGRGANGSPVTTAADNADAATLSGQYLDIAQNPYLQGAIAYAQQPVIQAFNSQILPGITGAFEGAGRTPQSDNLAGGAVQTATDTLARNLAGAATTAGANAYAQERANQMQAMQLAPSLADQDFLNLGAMLQVGQAIDQKQQQNIDADLSRYNYGQTAQPDYIANLAQLLQTTYPGAETNGNSAASGYTTQAFNGLGTGLSAPLLTFESASDRRLKTDIRPVGRLHDGQTVYAYRFRGNPRTELGLIAQEVEKRRPDAVVRHPSGFKMVDYRKATSRAATTRNATAPRGGLL